MKNIALEHGVPVLQPESINTPEGVRALQALQPDLLVVAAYGQILSRDVLAVPPHGGINVHASLLPKYRGAAPIAWAIYHGENAHRRHHHQHVDIPGCRRHAGSGSHRHRSRGDGGRSGGSASAAGRAAGVAGDRANAEWHRAGPQAGSKPGDEGTEAEEGKWADRLEPHRRAGVQSNPGDAAVADRVHVSAPAREAVAASHYQPSAKAAQTADEGRLALRCRSSCAGIGAVSPDDDCLWVATGETERHRDPRTPASGQAAHVGRRSSCADTNYRLEIASARRRHEASDRRHFVAAAHNARSSGPADSPRLPPARCLRPGNPRSPTRSAPALRRRPPARHATGLRRPAAARHAAGAAGTARESPGPSRSNPGCGTPSTWEPANSPCSRHIPAHAAVHETVELAVRFGRPAARGFLNGVLRQLAAS